MNNKHSKEKTKEQLISEINTLYQMIEVYKKEASKMTELQEEYDKLLTEKNKLSEDVTKLQADVESLQDSLNNTQEFATRRTNELNKFVNFDLAYVRLILREIDIILGNEEIKNIQSIANNINLLKDIVNVSTVGRDKLIEEMQK